MVMRTRFRVTLHLHCLFVTKAVLLLRICVHFLPVFIMFVVYTINLECT